MSKIASIICSNGLGHYKRSLTILKRLKQELPEAKFDVACEGWQVEIMRDYPGFQDFWDSPNVSLWTGITSPGVGWSDDQIDYNDGKLLNWKNNLAMVDCFKAADLVLSDNLAGVLEIRPDTILLGSFLWHEILHYAYPENKAVQQYVADDIGLLQKNSPPMLCVENIAMPAVLNMTTPIKLPWFGEEHWQWKPVKPAKFIDKLNIAIAGGAIPSVDNILVGIAELLASSTAAGIFVNRRLMSQVTPHIRNLCSSFNYTEEEFNQVDLMICRPGTGSLTDCICRGIPIVAVSEPGNIEMSHNGRCIQSSGYGLDAGVCESEHELLQKIQHWLAGNGMQKAGENLKSVNCEGYAEAVSWLLNYLDEK